MRTTILSIILSLFLLSTFSAAQSESGRAAVASYDLSKCIELALQNNQRDLISRESVEMALAVHKQALSAWWPKITGSIVASRMDEDPNFVFPASQILTPASSFTIPSTFITLPANLFGPGFPPQDVQLPLPPMNLNVPGQAITVPKQEVKLMNRDNLLATLNFTLPLYTGGLRESRIRQAKAGVEAARQDQRRTDLEIIYDVKRLYYAVVMGDQLIQISKDALARMEATMELTEKLYKTGSGTVKKTDYLRNKLVVETIRSMVAEAEGKEKTLRTMLLMVIGQDMGKSFTLANAELAFRPIAVDSNAILKTALANNPDIAKVEAAVRAAEFGVKAARSGHIPKVALVGKAEKIVNSYDSGMVTPENKSSWMIGVGVDIPIFEGFRVSNEVAEQKANLKKLQAQLSLLRDGIALQIRSTCHDLIKTQEKQKSTLEAFSTAKENRELNVRAYQEELVETKEVIEAQIMEALISANYQQVLYDYVEAQARLEFLTGIRNKAVPD
jgi:outer membrane protein